MYIWRLNLSWFEEGEPVSCQHEAKTSALKWKGTVACAAGEQRDIWPLKLVKRRKFVFPVTKFMLHQRKVMKTLINNLIC